MHKRHCFWKSKEIYFWEPINLTWRAGLTFSHLIYALIFLHYTARNYIAFAGLRIYKKETALSLLFCFDILLRMFISCYHTGASSLGMGSSSNTIWQGQRGRQCSERQALCLSCFLQGIYCHFQVIRYQSKIQVKLFHVWATNKNDTILCRNTEQQLVTLFNF